MRPTGHMGLMGGWPIGSVGGDLSSVICHFGRRLAEAGVLQGFDHFAAEEDEEDGDGDNAEDGAGH
jgi:hypothetical protein